MPLAVLLLFMMVAPRSAEANTIIKWTLNGVTFTDGGTATGSFFYDAATQDVSALDITTSGGSVGGYHYLDPNGDAPPYPSTGFAIVNPSADYTGARFLMLYFQSALTSTPGTILLSTSTALPSFEGTCTNSGCTAVKSLRFVKSGSIVGTSVPEPAALYLLGVGLIAVFLVRRKHSPNAR